MPSRGGSGPARPHSHTSAPRHSDRELRRALSHMHRGEYEDAARVLQAVTRSAPDDARAHANLGTCHMYLGKLDRARRSLRRSIEIEPQAESFILLSHIERASGDLEAAQDALSEGERHSDDPEPFITAKADLLHSVGESGEALELITPVVDANPTSSKAVAVFAKAALAEGDASAAADRLEALVERAELTPRSRAAILTRLGESYDKLGEFGKAFETYREANDAQPSRHNADEHDRLCSMLVEAWTPEIVERLGGVRSHSRLPVLIVGMPRSGTTLVEQIIQAHPEAHGGGELDALQGIIDGFQSDQGFQAPALLSPDALTRKGLERLGRKYSRALSTMAPDAQRVTDKMPSNFLHLGFFLLAFPDCKVVHCVRHPVDTALSCYFQNFGPTVPWSRDPEQIARYYASYRRVITHWKSLFPDRVVDVEYETLVRDVEGESRRLLEAAGLAWDDACLRSHESKRHVTTASADQVRKPVYSSSVSRHEKYGERAEPFREALRKHAGPDAF